MKSNGAELVFTYPLDNDEKIEFYDDYTCRGFGLGSNHFRTWGYAEGLLRCSFFNDGSVAQFECTELYEEWLNQLITREEK